MTAETVKQSSLAGKTVAITGRLASMTREDAVRLIEQRGGVYARDFTDDTSLLVVGQEGWPLSRDGHLTKSLQRARSLQEDAGEVQILNEGEFLGLAGLGDQQDGIRRLYTSQQLCRILKVSTSEIRHWIRIGLILPVRTVRRLCYFDFEQVSGAKTLCDLRKSGVGAERIRKSLELLETWLPSARRSLAQLGIMEEGGHLVLRLSSGQLADLSGQLHLDFPDLSNPEREEPAAIAAQPEGAPRSELRIVPGTFEDWFEVAIRHEEAGELELAAAAYHKALLHHGPKPEMCFNLGNVLYSQGRRDAAAQRYMQAVELDPEYVEAWNNLGNVFSELERLPAAIEAFEQALRIESGYADAHFNIGECLHQLGHTDRARAHWEEYLRQDPHSSWARRVRILLEETEGDAGNPPSNNGDGAGPGPRLKPGRPPVPPVE